MISIIIPCYNESGNVEILKKRLENVVKKFECKYELIFINDGSKDSTLDELKTLAKKNKEVKVINFSRNFGHQIAVTAGMNNASGDCVVLIDADLQDPPELIKDMYKKWEEGYHVVFAQREKRKGESIFKIFTAAAFYRILQKLTSVNIPVDTGDFRLMDKKVVEVLKNMPEHDRFIRGMVSWAGFKQTKVTYVREERIHGKTAYSFSKMLKFAITGITSFSVLPLKIASYIGMMTFIIAIFYGIYVLYLKIFTESTVQGWPSLMLVVLILGGLQLMVFGLFGEYLSRMYEELKKRPLYIIEEKINF